MIDPRARSAKRGSGFPHAHCGITRIYRSPPDSPSAETSSLHPYVGLRIPTVAMQSSAIVHLVDS